MTSCSVLGCLSSSLNKTPDLYFHRFPTDPFLRNTWIRATGRQYWNPDGNSRICSNHFLEAQYRLDKKCEQVIRGATPFLGTFLHYVKSQGQGQSLTPTRPANASQQKPKTRCLVVSPMDGSRPVCTVSDYDECCHETVEYLDDIFIENSDHAEDVYNSDESSQETQMSDGNQSKQQTDGLTDGQVAEYGGDGDTMEYLEDDLTEDSDHDTEVADETQESDYSTESNTPETKNKLKKKVSFQRDAITACWVREHNGTNTEHSDDDILIEDHSTAPAEAGKHSDHNYHKQIDAINIVRRHFSIKQTCHQLRQKILKHRVRIIERNKSLKRIHEQKRRLVKLVAHLQNQIKIMSQALNLKIS